MKVEIVEHQEDGNQRRVATFRLKDGEITCDNAVLWKHLMNSGGGAVIGARGKRYYPRDGVEYLRNLKYQFAGPYLFAHVVEDEKMPDLTGLVGTAGTSTISGRWSVAGASESPRVDAPDDTLEKTGLSKKAKPLSHRRELIKLPDNALARDVQENICRNVYRVSHTLRGLSLVPAHRETSALLELLASVVQVDFAALVRSFEGREEYLELRYQPPSRLNYGKLWDRVTRGWLQFLTTLEAGDLSTALWPLYLIREGLFCLPEHREEWISSQSFHPAGSYDVAGTTAHELQESWESVGHPAFRRRGLSQSLLEEIHRQADEPLHRAAVAFQQANLGQSELEARRALTIDPGRSDARLLLGDLLRRLDRVPEAIAELQQAIEIEHLGARGPKDSATSTSYYLRLSQANTCLGRTMMGLGRMREAIEHLERSLENLDTLLRRLAADEGAEAERAQVRTEALTLHRLLEPLYRSLGEVERADHHRRRFGASGGTVSS